MRLRRFLQFRHTRTLCLRRMRLSHFEGTLKSTIALTFPSKEILVVDNSNDSTADIIREYAAYGVRLLEQTDSKGMAGAYNQGIRAATGHVLVLLTADNRPDPDFLDRL